MRVSEWLAENKPKLTESPIRLWTSPALTVISSSWLFRAGLMYWSRTKRRIRSACFNTVPSLTKFATTQHELKNTLTPGLQLVEYKVHEFNQYQSLQSDVYTLLRFRYPIRIPRAMKIHILSDLHTEFADFSPPGVSLRWQEA